MPDVISQRHILLLSVISQMRSNNAVVKMAQTGSPRLEVYESPPKPILLQSWQIGLVVAPLDALLLTLVQDAPMIAIQGQEMISAHQGPEVFSETR